MTDDILYQEWKCNSVTGSRCCLLRETITQHDGLPDHVCLDTCRGSVRRWLLEAWPLHIDVGLLDYFCAAKYIESLEGGMQVLESKMMIVPQECLQSEKMLAEGEDDERVHVLIPLTAGVFVSALCPTQWPLRLLDGTGYLQLVVRMTVEEPPSESLAEKLQASSQWQKFLETLRYNPDHWTLTEKQRLDSDAMRHYLARYGLPSTNSTYRYVLYCLGLCREKCLPSRGCEVTAFCIEPGISKRHKSSEIARETGSILTHLSFPAEWMTEDLLDTARKAIERIKTWWSRISESGLPDTNLRKIARGTNTPHEQKHDIQSVLAGQMSRSVAVQREMEREKQRLKKSYLTPSEKETVENRVDQRYSRAKKSEKKPPDT